MRANLGFETRSLPTLTRSYPRHLTFYVARPTRSIHQDRGPSRTGVSGLLNAIRVLALTHYRRKVTLLLVRAECSLNRIAAERHRSRPANRLISEVCPGIARYDRGRGGVTESGAGSTRGQISNSSIAIAARDIVIWEIVPRTVLGDDVVRAA